MTRRMYDGITPGALPAGADLYAAYDDGHWPDAAAVAALHGGVPVVRITTNPADDEGDVLDVEKGDATPTDAPQWCERRRAAGATPAVYANASTVPAVAAAFTRQGVAMPQWWVADWTGIYAPPAAGWVARQWQSLTGYDVSSVVDYWPGVDPAPSSGPTPPPSTPPVHLPTGAVMHSVGITVAVKTGKGWAPSPVPAEKVVSVVVQDEDPGAVQRYDAVPAFAGVAAQAAPDAPNGAIVFSGGVDGTYGAVVWALT